MLVTVPLYFNILKTTWNLFLNFLSNHLHWCLCTNEHCLLTIFNTMHSDICYKRSFRSAFHHFLSLTLITIFFESAIIMVLSILCNEKQMWSRINVHLLPYLISNAGISNIQSCSSRVSAEKSSFRPAYVAGTATTDVHGGLL